MATISWGVRPSIIFASVPTASTLSVVRSTATTEGSLSTMPRPFTHTRVLAVPRSIATSVDRNPIKLCRNVIGLMASPSWRRSVGERFDVRMGWVQSAGGRQRPAATDPDETSPLDTPCGQSSIPPGGPQPWARQHFRLAGPRGARGGGVGPLPLPPPPPPPPAPPPPP